MNETLLPWLAISTSSTIYGVCTTVILILIFICCFRLTVRREHVLEDSFSKIMAASKKDLQKSKLHISFSGEEG